MSNAIVRLPRGAMLDLAAKVHFLAYEVHGADATERDVLRNARTALADIQRAAAEIETALGPSLRIAEGA